jgi:hypothetical protein
MSDMEEICQAAALMRQRAQAATPGPWLWDGGAYDGSRGVGCVWTTAPSVLGGTIATADMNDLYPRSGYSPQGDMKHIASWHPVVALAVADWLDHEADRIELGGPDIGVVTTPGEVRHSLAVARAYLAGERL